MNIKQQANADHHESVANHFAAQAGEIIPPAITVPQTVSVKPIVNTEVRFHQVQKHLRELAEQNGYTVIVAKLSPGELSAVRWAARHGIKSMGIDAFLKTALKEQVRFVAKRQTLMFNDVPQIVGEMLDKA